MKHLAQFLAKQLGENVGETVGYRIRGESKVSASTRLTIVTEGVLTRILQDDPELTGINAVLFDEFHERSVHADLGLAFAIESQQQLRPDLRLMVMSATLDVAGLQDLLPEAKHLESHGKMFPVEVSYLGDCKLEDVTKRTINAIQNAIVKHTQGDILVFLPSAKLIRQCQSSFNVDGVVVMPLYGALSLDEQTDALRPLSGARKVILATNIAETSLTIEGVTVVIDSGREQVAKFDHNTAVTTLSTKMISQPSSIQRMGRAGRVSAGYCYRLWAQTTQERLERQVKPSIKQVDIAAYLLDVLVWGTQFQDLTLIDQPDAAQLKRAFSTLLQLGIIDEKQRLTPIGNRAHHLGFHPRVAAMLLQAEPEPEEQQYAAAIAACLIDQANAFPIDADVLAHLNEALSQPHIPLTKSLRTSLAVFKLRFDDATLKSILGNRHSDIAVWIAIAYPERIAFKQSKGFFKLAYGPRFAVEDNVKESWRVVLHGLNQNGGRFNVFTQLQVELASLQARLGQIFSESPSLSLHPQKQQLEARVEKRVGNSVYDIKPMSDTSEIDWSAAWLQTFKSGEFLGAEGGLPLDETGKQWLTRARIAQYLKLAEFSHMDFSYEGLLDNAETWLSHQLESCRSLKHIQQLPWAKLLSGLLTWEQQQTLDSCLPAGLTVGTGQKKAVLYRFIQNIDKVNVSAHVAVKLQAMFGINQPVNVCNGRITITFELLSPAGRPLQTTDNLKAFWQGTYHEIAKEMRGRYPKHPWPDDPANTQAMAGTKKAHGM